MYSNGIAGLNAPTPTGIGQAPTQDKITMFPGSQIDPSDYALPSQKPISANVVGAGYEPKTDPYSGQMAFANGGIAALRYDEGGDVQQPAYANDEKGNLVDANGNIVFTAEARDDPYIKSIFSNINSPVANDPTEAQAFYDLKTKNPKQFYSQVADKLGSQIINSYQGNQNYDTEYNQLQALKEIDPAAYYRNQLGFKAHSMGWQVGQNRGERNAPTEQEIQSMIPEAQKAGLSEEEIGSIINQNFGQARNRNVQRIATLAETGGSGFSFQKDLQPILQNVGIAALTAGAAGAFAPAAGAGAGAVGAEVAPTLGTTLADAGLNLSNLQNAYKAYGLGKNILGVASSGGKNIGADIGAAKGLYSLGSTMMAAKGGVMNSFGGDLGSYSDGGRLLKGGGTGLSDDIPATIGDKQPARLADGEFVVSSDVVSALGGGSTDAGAKKLYAMMDRIRKNAHGTKKQIRAINDKKVLPA